mgnify:CR=1 FL=1
MRVRVTLNCPVKADQIATLADFLSKNLPNVRAADGCMSVGVLFDQDEAEMLLEEEWLSIAQHQAYIKSIEVSGVLAELVALLESAPTIKYFTRADI